MMFIGLGLSGVIPVVHGMTIYGYGGLEDRMSVSWVISQGALYIFGAVLYAVCIVSVVFELRPLSFSAVY